jgi:hypothetical protein
MAYQQPYSQFIPRVRGVPPGAKDFLSYCNMSMKEQLPVETPEGKYLAALIHEMFFKLYIMRLTAPATPTKIDEATWKAARYFQAHGTTQWHC